MRRVRFILLLVVGLVSPRVMTAQRAASAEIGASALSEAGIPASGAFTLGATLDAINERSSLRASALGVAASNERWTGQGLLFGTLLAPPNMRGRPALDGLVSVFGETGAKPVTSGELIGRAQLGSALGGASLGAGVGATVHGVDTDPLAQALGDAWWVRGYDRLSLGAAFTATRATFDSTSRVDLTARSTSYADLFGAWRHDDGAFGLGVSGGVRGQMTGARAANAWATADATIWVAANRALVFGVGQTLADVVRGVPRTRYASVAMRLSSAPHVSIGMHGPPIRGPRLTVTSTSDGRRVDVVADGASRVELMADFTDWAPIDLTRAGDVWRVELAIAPGLHRVAIRIDGGAWTAPANLPRVTDDLGGVVGLVAVP